MLLNRSSSPFNFLKMKLVRCAHRCVIEVHVPSCSLAEVQFVVGLSSWSGPLFDGLPNKFLRQAMTLFGLSVKPVDEKSHITT